MPDRFHVLMIRVATVILIVAFLLHYLRPDDDVYVGAIATAMGFLFGKFTNGFRRKEDAG